MADSCIEYITKPINYIFFNLIIYISVIYDQLTYSM